MAALRVWVMIEQNREIDDGNWDEVLAGVFSSPEAAARYAGTHSAGGNWRHFAMQSCLVDDPDSNQDDVTYLNGKS